MFSQSFFGNKLFFILICVTSLVHFSCASTKFYSSRDVEIISQSQQPEDFISGSEDFADLQDSSIHYIETSRSVKVKSRPDAGLFFFYTFGMPFVVTACTIRETARVVGYSVLNAFSGCFAYYRVQNHTSTNSFGFIFPDTKKAKAEYADMQEAYYNSDLYKYKKYRKPLTKAEITDNIIKEEVDWNDERKLISSETKTLSVKTSISDSAKRVSQKASITGSMVGSVSSVIFGIPSWVIGFVFAAVCDR